MKKFDPYDFSKKVIDGVPVYYKNLPLAPCIHINIIFSTGSIYDPKGKEGLSHFLEHMIFDGCPSLPNKKAIKEWSKIHTLNSWNAWTWFTNTNYHLKCLPEKIDIVLSGMKDMIFNPLLKDEDVEHERSVITQEAWGVYKNEKYLSFCKKTLDNVYHGTARVNTTSPLGWPDSIKNISQKDVALWHRTNYGKGNFSIVISGAIDSKTLEKMGKFLKTIPQAKLERIKFGELQKPKKNFITKTGEEIGDPREQAEISFERAIATKSAPSEEIQLMTSSLLQDILYERLRTEKALCYGISTGSYIQKDFLSWTVNLKIKEENVDVVKKEFWKALGDIISGKEKSRFDVLKKVRIDRLKSIEEVTEDITQNVLMNILKYEKIIQKEKMILERQKISYKDVVSCLKNAFKKEWTVIEVILPAKK
ncbi:MAG: pitrilysin family protein [Minisyncoccia bacterium]